MPTLTPRYHTPRVHLPRRFAQGMADLTALIPNGPIEAGNASQFLTRGIDGIAPIASWATETGTLSLVATAQGERRSVEESENGLLQLSAAQASALLNETTGSIALWITPSWAATDAPVAFPRIWDWGDNSDEEMRCHYTKSDDSIVFRREQGGSGANVTFGTAAHAAGESLLIVCAWDATKLYGSLNGGTIVEQAQSAVPDLSAQLFTFGRTNAATTQYINAAIGPIYLFDRALTQAEVNYLYASRWVPLVAQSF